MKANTDRHERTNAEVLSSVCQSFLPVKTDSSRVVHGYGLIKLIVEHPVRDQERGAAAKAGFFPAQLARLQFDFDSLPLMPKQVVGGFIIPLVRISTHHFGIRIQRQVTPGIH